MGLTKYTLGQLIELCGERNSDLFYGINDVRGVNNLKQLMSTKADLNGRDLSKFQIVNQGEFVFNHRTSRNGSKFSIAYNDGNYPVICTEDYVVFKIRDDSKKVLNPRWLYMFFNRPEFDRFVITNSWGSSTEFYNWEDIKSIELILPAFTIQQKYVDVYNANIPSKIVEEIIISDISLDAFTKMIQTYKVEEFGNGLKDFTPEQIGIMIRQKCIPFKPELLDEVQDKASELATEYIQNNRIEFVDNLENCNLTVDVVTCLIRNNEFNDSQKLIILQKISEDEVNLSLAMAIRELEFAVPKEYVEAAWEILAEEDRYQLFLNHLNIYTLDEISEKLSLLAPDYRKLADRSKRHKENLHIDEIGYNEALLKKLHDLEYLTSVEVEDYLTHNIKTHKKETHQRFVVWVKKANE